MRSWFGPKWEVRKLHTWQRISIGFTSDLIRNWLYPNGSTLAEAELACQSTSVSTFSLVNYGSLQPTRQSDTIILSKKLLKCTDISRLRNMLQKRSSLLVTYYFFNFQVGFSLADISTKTMGCNRPVGIKSSFEAVITSPSNHFPIWQTTPSFGPRWNRCFIMPVIEKINS